MRVRLEPALRCRILFPGFRALRSRVNLKAYFLLYSYLLPRNVAGFCLVKVVVIMENLPASIVHQPHLWVPQ